MSLDDVHLGSIIAFHDGHLSINKAYHAKLIYRYLGESYEMNNQHMQAIKYWNRTIDIDPLNIDAYIMRGVCHYKTGNYLYAAGEFARAIRLDPQNSKAVETLTKILDRSLKFNRMINDLFALGESKDSLTNDDISAILSSYTFTSNEIDAVISYMHRKVTDIVDE
jgi:tetratricopeptide (TPR) repeat protein